MRSKYQVFPTAAGVIESAARRARVLRGAFIFLGALLAYVSFTANSASYSVFQHIALTNFGLGAGHDEPIFEILGIKPTGKSVSKTIFFFLLLAAFWFVIEVAEPFSDREHLADLANPSGKHQWSWIHNVPFAPLRNDLEAYAQSIPSPKLAYLCDRCGNSDSCQNAVSSQAEYIGRHSIPVWVLTKPAIEPELLSRLLTATARCRIIHYSRLTFLIVGYFGAIFYFGHLLFEKLDGVSGSLSKSPASWGIPIFCFGVVALTGIFNNPTRLSHGLGGVWSRLKSISEELCSRPDVGECHAVAFERVVCARDGNLYRFSQDDAFKAAQINLLDARLSRSLLLQMDVLVAEKLTRILRYSGETTLTPLDYIEGVLRAVERFFTREFCHKGDAHCTAEYMHSLDDFFVVAGVALTTRNQEIQAIADELRRSGVAICSIQGFGRSVGRARGGSIVVAQVAFSPHHVANIQDDLKVLASDRINVNLHPRGYLIVRSPDQRTFVPAKLGPIRLALSPFIHRLMYEVMRNEVSTEGGS